MAFAIKTKLEIRNPRRLWSAIEAADLAELQNCRTDEINSSDEYGITPLLHAVWLGRIDVVQTLIDRGGNVNASRADGFTPLHLASFFGHTDVVRLLIEREADFRVTTRSDTTAEMWAAARGFHEIVDYLREHRARAESFASCETVLADDDLPQVGEPALAPTSPIVAERSHETAVVKTIESSRAELQQSRSVNSIEPLVVRKLKEPPEIWDLVHESPSSFNVRSAFLSHIRGIKATTAAVMLVPILIAGVWAFTALRWGNKASDVKHTGFASESSKHEPPDRPDGAFPVAGHGAPDSQSVVPEVVPTDSGQQENGVGSEIDSSEERSADTMMKRSTSMSRRVSSRRSSEGVDNSGSVSPAEPVVQAPPEVPASVQPVATTSPAVQKRSTAGNSHLIERPSNNPPAKAKIIQWP